MHDEAAKRALDRQTSVLRSIIIHLAVILVCAVALRAEDAANAKLIGGSWFQPLGNGDDGAPLWLYPHIDGVNEVFKATAGQWEGTLGSKFNPQSGEFSNLFNAAEVLNEFIAAGTSTEGRVAAARLLRLFLAARRAGDTPYYLREFLPKIDEKLKPADLEWIAKMKEVHERALAGVKTPGVRIAALSRASSSLDASEYYRRMIQDGYLDIAVVGGNLYAEQTGVYNSMKTVDDFVARIVRQGFKAAPFRSSPDKTLYLKTVRLLNQPVTVRLNVTGGSSRDYRIRRGVGNFVEGLANADVVIYHGHSNKQSGTYFVSETCSDYSRFRIGMGDQQDLLKKCYGLNEKSHQILIFQSCSSYEKYCRPIRWFYEDTLKDAAGNAGFVGNAAYCYQVDFAPRYAEFISQLLQGKGAREILARVGAIRPDPQTPHLILRGVLQSRFTFIVPRNVEISAVREEDASEFNLVTGVGSDGMTYASTEMFAQDRRGELQQVAAFGDGVYGLMDDGRLYECSRASGGAMVEAAFMKNQKTRFTFITRINEKKDLTLALITTDGIVCHFPRNAVKLCRAPWQPPKGVTFSAIGDAGSDIAATDAEGRQWLWNTDRQQFSLTDVPLEYTSVSPSLAGRGVAGVLWTAKDRVK